jgi:hypothetical protein
MADSLDTLQFYVDAIVESCNAQPDVAQSQVFIPTCYPSEITVVPGVVMHRSGRVEYAPDIEVAEKKVRTLNALAKAGKIATMNVSVEPGSGKTLFLPFRFTESRSLVVLPTVFDAWVAHTSATGLSNIVVYGFASKHNSRVTYTDSYHAAYLITTTSMSDYDIVFVDESHSQEGVTSFVSSVARPGLIFVRMTASPPTINSHAKKSFSIMDERDVPDIQDIHSSAAYIASRSEPRVMVLSPSAATADDLSSRVPGSYTFTASSPLAQLKRVLTTQNEPAVIITDAVCGKAINLNADCSVDFGYVSTPNGNRTITRPEQLQRRHRVGRNKPGVYCCAYTAKASRVVDNYSVYRSNLWLIVNKLQPDKCDFYEVTIPFAVKLIMTCLSEPALAGPPSPVPDSQHAFTPAPDDSDESAVSITSMGAPEPDKSGEVHCELIIDDESEPDTEPEVNYLLPSWYSYYVHAENHPAKYVGDLIHEHRGVASRSIKLNSECSVRPAPNRVAQIAPALGISASTDAPDSPTHHGPRYSVGGRKFIPRVSEVDSTSGSSVAGTTSTAQRRRSRDYEKSDYHEVKHGSRAISVRGYAVTDSGRHAQGVMRNDPVRLSSLGGPLAKTWISEVGFDGVHVGGPLVILRANRFSGSSRGAGYKAVSVCGGYVVHSGVILASGAGLHPSLTPIHTETRRSLSASTTERTALNATHYLSWVVARPLGSVNIESEVKQAKAVGAWSVPPMNTVPVIDLETEYHPSWSTVIADRIRNGVALPPLVPRGGWTSKPRGRRHVSDDVLDDAFDACDQPTYTKAERIIVTHAWNVIAMRSAAVGPIDKGVFLDAGQLLEYLAGADRLSDL